ncbi:MAG: hypothetical protein QM802_20720 [Agriterribacter sp.]
MEHFSNEMEKVLVDYSRADLPDTAKNFMPDVYRDGEQFLCVLRSEAGPLILGSGTTLEKALMDWSRSFEQKFRETGGKP